MLKALVALCVISVALAQTLPDGAPRLSGAGYVTTDCKNLVLGQEPPFPFNYIDEVNNYLYPNIRLLQSQRELPGNYRRTFHFPTIGCVDGTFDVRADLPTMFQKGIFKPGISYPAFIRFSGFDQEVQNPAGGDTKGLAVKLFNVPGRKMLPGFETDTHFDIVNNAAPVFTFSNETGFAAGVMSRTQLCGGGDACRSRFGTFYPADAARSAAEHKNNTVDSVLKMPYYGISPYKFGLDPLPAFAVKYRWFPCTGVNPAINYTGATADYLTIDMTQRLAATAYCFWFQLQVQKDPCLHPINDFGVEWLETDTPYITVATLNIPAQVVQTDNNNTCKHTAMNAWRVIEDHRPIGSINRARLFAMMNSHNQRLSLNNVVEPITGLKHPGFQFWTPDELGINTQFTYARIKDGFPGNPLPYSPVKA
jgi:catalase